MGKEFALLNDLAAEQEWEVFEKIWDLIFCRLPAPTAYRSHEEYFQRTGERKKKILVLFTHQEAEWYISMKGKNNSYPHGFPWWNKYHQKGMNYCFLLDVSYFVFNGGSGAESLRIWSTWGLAGAENNRNQPLGKSLQGELQFALSWIWKPQCCQCLEMPGNRKQKEELKDLSWCSSQKERYNNGNKKNFAFGKKYFLTISTVINRPWSLQIRNEGSLLLELI